MVFGMEMTHSVLPVEHTDDYPEEDRDDWHREILGRAVAMDEPRRVLFRVRTSTVSDDRYVDRRYRS